MTYEKIIILFCFIKMGQPYTAKIGCYSTFYQNCLLKYIVVKLLLFDWKFNLVYLDSEPLRYTPLTQAKGVTLL